LWELAGSLVMVGVGLVLVYLAIAKGYEPLLLLPIGFGAVLANIPGAGLAEPGGILHLLRVYGIETELLPSLLFIGIGAMCDFSSLIRRPMLLVFAAAGQLGIFVTLNLALALGFAPLEASSISVIGAMDGPTAIFVTQRFAPHLLGAVTVCAYSYMSLVPLLQIPLSKLLTTGRERRIRMDHGSEELPRAVRVIFPVVVFLVSSLLAPQGAPLMGSLMLGNLMRESGVVRRLSEAAEKELTNIVTLLLGLSIGGTMRADEPDDLGCFRPRPRRLRIRPRLGAALRQGSMRPHRRQDQPSHRRLRRLRLPHGRPYSPSSWPEGGSRQLAAPPSPGDQRRRADRLRSRWRRHPHLRPSTSLHVESSLDRGLIPSGGHLRLRTRPTRAPVCSPSLRVTTPFTTR